MAQNDLFAAGRDRIDEDIETEGGGVCTQWYAGVQQ